MIEQFPVLQYCRSCCRGVARTMANAAQRYLWSLDHPALLALFTSTTVALIVHKVTLISLRFPPPHPVSRLFDAISICFRFCDAAGAVFGDELERLDTTGGCL